MIAAVASASSQTHFLKKNHFFVGRRLRKCTSFGGASRLTTVASSIRWSTSKVAPIRTRAPPQDNYRTEKFTFLWHGHVLARSPPPCPPFSNQKWDSTSGAQTVGPRNSRWLFGALSRGKVPGKASWTAGPISDEVRGDRV